MKLFFIIVAGMVVGFLLIVLVLYLLIRFWLRRTFKQLGAWVSDAAKGIVPFMQPLRITLEREQDPQWTDKTTVDRVVRPLLAASFQDAGVFTLEEVPDIHLQALAQAEKSVYAAVYEHPDNGVWFDLVSRYEDGAALTYTTAKATGLDHPTNKLTERFEPDADPAHVYEQHLARRPHDALAPASPERFKADFERAYAEEMDWRFERGGFTEDEIRNNLKLLGTDTTDQNVKQVHVLQQAQVSEWLQTKLKENFRAKSNLSDVKWRKIEHRVIFVHDRMTSEEVHGAFTNCLDWGDEDTAQKCSDEAQKLAHGSAREAFALMIQTLPADRALKKVSHLAQPVVADVYLGPEDMHGEDD